MRQISAALLICLGTGVLAQEAPPGAMSCTGCHGLFPDAPNSITDLSADKIETAMAGFRDGTRKGTVMPRLAPGFSDTEIRAIAEWFADQEDAQ